MNGCRKSTQVCRKSALLITFPLGNEKIEKLGLRPREIAERYFVQKART